MEAKGLTNLELAKLSDASDGTISKLRRGIDPPGATVLRKIAPHLGVRHGDLLVAAGLSTPDELGMIGKPPPPPSSPIPPVLRRIASRLMDPRIHADHKHQLLATIDQLVGMWDEMRKTPIYREPKMRSKR